MIFKIFIYITGVYFLILSWMFFMQRSMMYFPQMPQTSPSDFQNLGIEKVQSQTQDSLKLTGWFFKPMQKTMPIIVMFHGNAGAALDRVPGMVPFLKAGYGVLLAEYRGYGGNPGSPSETGFYEDGRTWMKWLKMVNILESNIVLYGESVGTGVVSQIAIEHPIVKAVILEAPFTSAVDIAQETYPIFPVRWLMKDRYQTSDRIEQIKAPLLILHGRNDKVVPYRHAQKLYDRATQPKQLIILEGAGHSDMYEYGSINHMISFISELDTPAHDPTKTQAQPIAQTKEK